MGEKTYTIEIVSTECMRFSVDGTYKNVKVEKCWDFVWSCKKTKIKAVDGVEGLYKAFDKHLLENEYSYLHGAVVRAIEHAVNNMKEYKFS